MNCDRITLRPLAGVVKFEELLVHGPAIVCDFYIEGIESIGTPTPWGFRVGEIENVDHHAPERRFWQQVSSTNLAILKVEQEGIASEGQAVMINHTDCDSILTSAIVAGLLPPASRYGDAAIAADHTGEANAIADLLQGLDNNRDVELSLRSLSAMERGDALPAEAARALEVRLASREEAKEAVLAGKFAWIGDIAWAEFNHEIDGELFPVLMPEACAIVIGHPYSKNPSRRVIKARLSAAAPAGMSLQDLRIKEHFDPAWGGRWNGGSTKREGGTELGVEEWAGRLAERVALWKEKTRSPIGV